MSLVAPIDTPLCELAKKHGTDKKSKHNYTPTYYAMFKDRVEGVRRILEIGIKRGASLYMWEEFFPNAQVFGIDNNPKRLITAGRIKSFLADQLDAASLRKVAAVADGLFDVIIDDGSHIPEHQLLAARTLLPSLASDGIYVIEDVRDQKIVERIPRGHHSEIIRTGDVNFDSVLAVIRKAAVT